MKIYKIRFYRRSSYGRSFKRLKSFTTLGLIILNIILIVFVFISLNQVVIYKEKLHNVKDIEQNLSWTQTLQSTMVRDSTLRTKIMFESSTLSTKSKKQSFQILTFSLKLVWLLTGPNINFVNFLNFWKLTKTGVCLDFAHCSHLPL